MIRVTICKENMHEQTGTTCSLASPCSLIGARDQARSLLSGMSTMSGNLIIYLNPSGGGIKCEPLIKTENGS